MTVLYGIADKIDPIAAPLGIKQVLRILTGPGNV
jgi:hypothetical protein